jgi:hypothetical protein
MHCGKSCTLRKKIISIKRYTTFQESIHTVSFVSCASFPLEREIYHSPTDKEAGGTLKTVSFLAEEDVVAQAKACP